MNHTHLRLTQQESSLMRLRATTASLIMTSIAEGEYFPLYLARLRCLACEDLVPGSLLWPSKLRPLIEQLRDYVGPVENVEDGHSLLPLFTRSVPIEDAKKLRDHFYSHPKKGVAAITGLSGPRSGWARAAVARCPKCIEENVAPCGNPFWMREHLVPGLLFCARHQMPLHLPCARCADFEGHPKLTTHPGMHCGCGLRPLSAATTLADSEVIDEVELSNVASRLLDPTYLPYFNHAGVATVVARAAQSHGLVEDGFVNWRRVDALFNDESHRHILSRTSFPSARENSFRLALTGKRVLRHPLHNVVLLRILHGAWHVVEDAFARLTGHESATIHEQKPSGVRLKPKSQIHREKWVATHRARWCQHYTLQYREARKAYTNETHTQLMRRISYDASLFITRASLTAAGEDVPLFGFGDKYYEALDKSFCLHIHATAKSLIEARYPERISKRILRRGHRMDGGWSQIKARMPLAVQALTECEETILAFRRRRLKMLLKSSRVLSLYQLTEKLIDDLDEKTVIQLLKQGGK